MSILNKENNYVIFLFFNDNFINNLCNLKFHRIFHYIYIYIFKLNYVSLILFIYIIFYLEYLSSKTI